MIFTILYFSVVDFIFSDSNLFFHIQTFDPDVEESSNIIRPQEPPNPLKASKSHQELHQELLTHKAVWMLFHC
uniref:Uncharacterized protein n=1 Tax=Gasterosteus aculeatus aculeatus TaxID=481459 RepID=A0AAQ4QYB2_GASAC